MVLREGIQSPGRADVRRIDLDRYGSGSSWQTDRQADPPEEKEDLNRLVMRQLATQGVVILRVPSGTGAAAAGLRGTQIGADGRIIPGDIIVALNGQAIDGVPRLLARLDDYQVGDDVRVTVLRDGRPVEVTVTLQAGV